MSTATVSLILGTWGAVVSTVLAVRDILHGRRSLKLDCREAIADDQILIRVRAVNEGRRPIEVRSVTFRLADGSEMFPPTPVAGGKEFPALLGDGQSATVHYEKAALDRDASKHGSRVALAVVGDANGKAYFADYPRRSRPRRRALQRVLDGR